MSGEDSKQMKVLSYLYDESGDYEKVELSKDTIKNLNDRQLLWINIPARDKELINRTIMTLQLSDIPVNHIIRSRKRPKIFKFQDFYYFFIVSVETDENKQIRPVPIDCLVGKNFVITIYDEEVSYLREFTDREEGETSSASSTRKASSRRCSIYTSPLIFAFWKKSKRKSTELIRRFYRKI